MQKVAKMAKSPRAERADFFLVIWPLKKKRCHFFFDFGEFSKYLRGEGRARVGGGQLVLDVYCVFRMFL